MAYIHTFLCRYHKFLDVDDHKLFRKVKAWVTCTNWNVHMNLQVQCKCACMCCIHTYVVHPSYDKLYLMHTACITLCAICTYVCQPVLWQLHIRMSLTSNYHYLAVFKPAYYSTITFITSTKVLNPQPNNLESFSHPRKMLIRRCLIFRAGISWSKMWQW